MSSVNRIILKRKMEYGFYFYIMGCCLIAFRDVSVSQKHSNQSLGSVVSDVTEHNLSDMEDEPADTCELLVFFTKCRTNSSS